jgi:osmotically-inducible protein OsmY
MTKTSVKVWALITCLGALSVITGLTGCAANRYNQSTNQRVEDSRTAERVREALAAVPEYKFDGVQVAACKGVVQLSGFVNASAQRNRAGKVARKVVGVKDVVNDITVKE